jgi:hypothetical protein
MGLEENINNILQITSEIHHSLQGLQTAQINAEIEHLINQLSIQLETVQNDFQTNLNSILRELRDTANAIGPETLNSIAKLPSVLNNIEESFSTLTKKFDASTRETKDDLKFIKVSYVEDVVTNIRNLSKEMIDIITSSTERTKGLYEASVNNFVPISDGLNNIESSLNALINNQTDQLATVADMRDRVNAIIQVELEALKTTITILESSINELKTSLTEHLAIQEGAIKQLSANTKKINETLTGLPSVLNKEINKAIETKLIAELDSMKKEMKKMTAFIVRTQRTSGS